MAILTDAEGFMQPVVFLILSLVILGLTYKKRTHYVWLSIVPIIALFMYQSHIEDVRIMNKQVDYATFQWTELYQPLMLDMSPTTYSDSEAVDEWLLETESGQYILHFEADQYDGFEVVRTLDEYEPLRGRRNVLDAIVLLDLAGHLHFDGTDYTLTDDNEIYQFTMTNTNRVDEVIRSDGDIIYANEEEKDEKIIIDDSAQ